MTSSRPSPSPGQGLRRWPAMHSLTQSSGLRQRPRRGRPPGRAEATSAHPASAPTAAAAPAPGRPPPSRPLTPPPPLSGPERAVAPERVAAGGDTAAHHHSSPLVRRPERVTCTLTPRESFAPAPTSPAAASAASQSVLLGLRARSGRGRARRHVTARHVTGGGDARGGSGAAHRGPRASPSRPWVPLKAALRAFRWVPALCVWGFAVWLPGSMKLFCVFLL